MPSFGERSKVYPFTTENLAEYMGELGFEGKNVLTVIGSGDHVINPFFFGAKSVVGFDINRLALLFAELKIKALQHLDIRDFKDYFFTGSKRTMDHRIYEGLKRNLSEECVSFFDSLYKKYKKDGRQIRQSKLFNKRFDINELRTVCNLYLHSDFNYIRTRINIRNGRVKLINSDVRDLTSKLEDNFEVILLSNLADYSQDLFPGETNYLDSFCEEILVPLRKHLTLGGIICAAYVYDTREGFSENRKLINRSELRQETFRRFGFNYLERRFKSIVPGKEDKQDSVILLTEENGRIK
ncbi:MAG: DUF3419 family protein [Candidatus Pacearchaeota archaeon]